MNIDVNEPFLIARVKNQISKNNYNFNKIITKNKLKQENKKNVQLSYTNIFFKFSLKIWCLFRNIEICEVIDYFDYILDYCKMNDLELCMFINFILTISKKSFYYNINFRTTLNDKLFYKSKNKLVQEKMVFILFILVCSKLYLNSKPFETTKFDDIVANIFIFKNEIYYFNKLIKQEIKNLIYPKINSIYEFITIKNLNAFEIFNDYNNIGTKI